MMASMTTLSPTRMLAPALSGLRRPLQKFLAARSGPFPRGVSLDRSRVYILPTKAGALYALLLLLLLLGAINYAKSLGFLLTFLLAGLGHIAMLLTWRNLAGLRLKGMAAAPVFAGERAWFSVRVENPAAEARYALAARYRGEPGETIDIGPARSGLLRFSVCADKRGWLRPGAVRVETEFPLGLFVAWTYVDLALSALVYPAPAESRRAPPPVDTGSGEEHADGDGLEDFIGLRKYQNGDSWRRVSWKAAARTGQLYAKEFRGGQPRLQWIDWFALAVAGTERRLSIMTRMALDAERAGRVYGVRAPGFELRPGRGRAHRHEALKALALYH